MTTHRAPTPHGATAASASSPSSSTGTTGTIAPADLLNVPYPPANAVAPSPPAGFEPVNSGKLGGLSPRKGERLALAGVVAELATFTDFDATFGKTAPPLAQVQQMFSAAAQWSTVRTAAAAWDEYCKSQEEVIWTVLRAQMARMAPSFDSIVKGDPTFASKYPDLATLFGARTAISSKGASTRQANARDKAAGKPATHGAVGRRAQRKAAKAALTAAQNTDAHAVSAPSAPVATVPAVPAVGATNHS